MVPCVQIRSLPFASRPQAILMALAVVASLGLLLGCSGNSSSSGPRLAPIRTSDDRPQADSLLAQAMEDIQNPERFNRVYDDELAKLSQTSITADIQRMLGGDPDSDEAFQLTFEKESDADRRLVFLPRNPETLDSVVDRLNQWIRTLSDDDRAKIDWQRDPLWQTLPANIRNNAVVFAQERQLDSSTFQQNKSWLLLHDGWVLQQRVWMRDLGDAIVGNAALEPLPKAERLFDWVIRNIQLIPGSPEETEVVNGRQQLVTPPMEPWRFLLAGKGHAEWRAWLFVLLARQQRLPVVMLGYPDFSTEAGVRPWMPAAFIDGELYPFEPTLGTAIPGPDGQTPATLTQLIEDFSLLEQLIPEGVELPQPSPEQRQGLVALIEADPGFLQYRMRALQRFLTRQDQLVLSVEPSKLAAEVQEHAHIKSAQLWDRPYRTTMNLQNPALMSPANSQAFNEVLRPFYFPQADLWSGRVMHLKGIYAIDPNRPTVNRLTGEPLRGDFREGANQLYLRVRDRAAKELPLYQRNLQQSAVPPETLRNVQIQAEGLLAASEHAGYWLGLVAFERALASRPESEQREEALLIAATYFQVILTNESSPWEAGARYNLGRVYEELGDIPSALATYRADTTPHRPASLVRAKQLAE